MKTSFRIALPCALALSFAAGAAHAQNFGPNDSREIWMENTRAQIWKNGFGECWHSAFGPPPSYNECNPAPVAQYVPPPAPVGAPPAPPPPRVVAPPVVRPAPLPPRKTRG